jgi:superfamily II DNA helicase RecQ
MDVDMDTNSPENRPSTASQTAFHHAPFPFQLAATQSMLAGKDTVVIAPVGAGKSSISRLLLHDPSTPSDAMVIIVTPFDNFQVVHMKGMSTAVNPAANSRSFLSDNAIYLNKKSETTQSMKDIAAKRYQRIYTTSQQLESLAFQKLFQNEKWSKKVVAIVVDDAHDVVEQREQTDLLRPRYRELSEFRHRKRDRIPILVLSSTLPLHVYHTLAETLKLENPTIINIGSDRPNVSMSVREFDGTWGDIKRQMPALETLRTGGKFSIALRTLS